MGKEVIMLRAFEIFGGTIVQQYIVIAENHEEATKLFDAKYPNECIINVSLLCDNVILPDMGEYFEQGDWK
jgi:hypothetical protein